MKDKHKNIPDNTRKKPIVIPASHVVENPNPRANENIRVRSDESKQNDQASKGIGSEITDGEDA